MAKSTVPAIVAPKFNPTAYLRTLRKADKAALSATAVLSQTIMMYLDSCAVAGLVRDSKTSSAISAAIRAGFADAIASMDIEKGTVYNYANGAARAWFHNVDWEPTTFQNPALAVPNANGKTKVKSGSVTTTNNAALVKTLVKALEQCRTIGNDTLAAGIVDLILEVNPEFKEATGE